MNLAVLSFKNARVKMWRSMTLGFFIFTVVFIMLISNSFITAARDKVGNVILKGFTGHIQLRSGKSMEGDMVVQYIQGWDALKPIDPETLKTIDEILSRFPDINATGLVRRSVSLESGKKKLDTMLVGLEPGMESYKEAFMLSEGTYLNPDKTNEVVLTKEQANTLGLNLGDYVKATTKNRYGLKTEAELKIVGIGDFIMLSLFSYNANYTHLSVVRDLAGYEDSESTDILMYLPDNRKIHDMANELSSEFASKGVKCAITAEEKLTSEDLQVSDISFNDSDTDKKEIMLSTIDEMGETFKGVSGTLFVVLSILTVFLMIIVSVLIFNLVYMTGIERYREIGTYRAIGFSKFQVIRVFMGEIIIVTGLSAILGILVSLSIVTLLNRAGVSSPLPFLTYIMGETLLLKIDPQQIILNLLIIMGFSFFSSFLPASRACSFDPAEAIRTV